MLRPLDSYVSSTWFIVTPAGAPTIANCGFEVALKPSEAWRKNLCCCLNHTQPDRRHSSHLVLIRELMHVLFHGQ